LHCTPNNVGDEKHEHAELPPPSPVWRPPLVFIFFLLLEQMRLALQREPDALDGGRDEADEDSNLR
jgi:hypothetical protein